MISHSDRETENENTENTENTENIENAENAENTENLSEKKNPKIDSMITVKLSEFLNHPSSVLTKYSKTHPIRCEVCDTGYFLVGFCSGRDHTKLAKDVKFVNHSENCLTCVTELNLENNHTQNTKNQNTKKQNAKNKKTKKHPHPLRFSFGRCIFNCEIKHCDNLVDNVMCGAHFNAGAFLDRDCPKCAVVEDELNWDGAGMKFNFDNLIQNSKKNSKLFNEAFENQMRIIVNKGNQKPSEIN